MSNPLSTEERDRIVAHATTTLRGLVEWAERMKLTGHVCVSVHLCHGEPRNVKQAHEGVCN